MRLSSKRAFVFLSAFAMTMMVPAIALAQEGAAAGAAPQAWQAVAGKAIGASLAIGISAWSAGYAQSRIGAAGAGTLAERPEAATFVIVLTALPEIVALLGFVMAFLINSA
jgi:V/A-type H+/Na+-transporting ATPase subunit K